MTGELEGVRALVTGASRGVGRAVAEAYASRGARVVASATTDEHLGALVRTADDSGWSVDAVGADLGVPAQAERLGREAAARLGRIDVLVNNAGGQFPTPARTLTPKGFETVIRNNLSGTFFITREIADRVMIPARSGAIVNVIANIYRGFPGMSHTGAARAGVSTSGVYAEADVVKAGPAAVSVGTGGVAARVDVGPVSVGLGRGRWWRAGLGL